MNSRSLGLKLFIQIHLFDSNFTYFMKLKKLYTYQAMQVHFAITLMNKQKDGYKTTSILFVLMSVN